MSGGAAQPPTLTPPADAAVGMRISPPLMAVDASGDPLRSAAAEAAGSEDEDEEAAELQPALAAPATAPRGASREPSPVIMGSSAALFDLT